MLQRAIIGLLALWFLSGAVCGQDEPRLPEGLEDAAEAPALPEGLIGEEDPGLPEGLEPEEGPPLPPGLGEEEEAEAPRERTRPTLLLADKLPFDVRGFWETRIGVRTRRDPYERRTSLGETRLHLELEKHWEGASATLTPDFLFDPVGSDYGVKLEQGRGWLDLREANVAFSPLAFMDVKAGRQILTWGTGDMLFINDLFPKDWNAFFIGRGEEYLKAPSDAVKTSFYGELANLDVVYAPRFDPDRYIDGRRISYWNSGLRRRAGRDAIVRVGRPDSWWSDDELAMRLYRTVGGYELAAYGYRGFWKSPSGVDPVSGRATFPGLSVYGASVRGKVGKGIGNVEVGWYDSGDDPGGDDPNVRNGELRFLAGYEQELAEDFTGGLQYYVEHMMDYGDYGRSLPAGDRAADEDRHVATLRLTKLLDNQNLRLSLFTYYSPSDNDAYLRPDALYKVNDHWSVEVGANVFLRDEPHTFFGQFSRDSNVFAALRGSF